MPKYAPAREDGLKPYVVAIQEWGKLREIRVYAKDAQDARWSAFGRSRPGVYHVKTRRATPEDLAPSGDSRALE